MQQLDRAIDAHFEKACAFLEALVRVPSVAGFEQPAMEIFADEATAIGLEVERMPFASGPVTDPRAGIAPLAEYLSGNRYQVVAKTPGDGDLRLLLNGHMDVVPADSPHLWTNPPFEPVRCDGKMYGRGTGDMKSGFAVGMLALRALRDVKPHLFAKRRLGFVAVVEEECTGNGTLRSITDNRVVANEVVVLEPTNLGLMLGGVGVLWMEIEVSASAGHAYESEAHQSAIEIGMRIIDRLRAWSLEIAMIEPEVALRTNQTPYSLNLGKIEAGDWISSVPARATFGVRVGFPRSWTAEKAEASVREAVADFASSAQLQILPRVTSTGFRARGYLLDKNHALVRDLATAHRQAHGSAPPMYMLPSTTDARMYLNDFNIPALCFGASAHNIHGVDEHVELQSIVDAARTLTRFLLTRFAGNEAST
jgi:acetylornithine deacetylase